MCVLVLNIYSCLGLNKTLKKGEAVEEEEEIEKQKVGVTLKKY